MVLRTWVIEWQAVQARPTLASAVSTSSVTGLSNMPLNSTARSWQPAHHFDGWTPTTDCMYSIDFRYHWLLNDEWRCIDERHWATMSGWQPEAPQVSEVMKNVDGIRPLVEVEALD